MLETTLQVKSPSQGLHSITEQINRAFSSLPDVGLLNCFIPHTSASLLIQENADPTAKQDLETFFNLLAPENQNWHRHTLEGPDDTTSHLKAALTQTSLNIPIRQGRLALGTWQGVYLFEHRHGAPTRKVLLTVI